RTGRAAARRAVVGRSGWRGAARIGGRRVGVRTTGGRRSGRPRTVPLMYLDDDGYVLVGSNGGAPRDPAWVLNLRAAPTATIEVAEGRVAVRAEEVVDEAERV